ncbi:18823_t:CDS:10 [Funneliformis geosporum]|nr:18823_t:CDS:10 [Funneliformis geosporum]
MPPLPISTVALPGAFISAIIEGNREKDNDSVKEQQNTLLATSSDREAVFSCIQRIDDKIRSVKTEALQIILNHKDDFVNLYNDSVSLRDRIDTLFTEVHNVSQEINRPETGMRPNLINVLQENRSVMQEVQNTKSVVETLEYLSEIQKCIKKFHEYLDQGRIEEASGTITQMSQLSNMKESLDQTLDDLLTQSISFKKIGENESNLTVLSSVEGRREHHSTFNISVYFPQREVDDSITARLVIGPDLNDKNTSQDRVFAPLVTIFKFIYTFIFGGLDPSTKELVILPLATQYSSTFGKFISHDLRDAVIDEYLSHVIPTETFEFKRFDEVAHDVICFQAEMRKMGFMREPRDGEEEESTLGSYVAKVDVHFTIKKRDKLLELGRNVMMGVNFESEEITEEQNSEINDNAQETLNNKPVIESSKIGEINEQKEEGTKDIFAIHNVNNNPSDGWEVDWNEGWDGDDDWDKSNNSQKNNENLISKDIISEQGMKLVRYSISNKGKALIDLVIKTLNEIPTLDLFDLFRAIMPVFHHNTFSNIPSLAMLFRNDCLWLADQLLVVQDQFKNDLISPSSSGDSVDIKGKISYNDTVEKLRELGKTWYDIQMDKQKSVLKEILDEMGGVQQIANDERFEACQSAMNQIVYTMNHLSKVWKDILRPTEYFTVLGDLIDSVLTRMTDYIEDLYDISAEESQQLNLICTMLCQLENLFNRKEINSIEKHIKHWTKFRHMTDILDLPLAGIMSRFRNGELVCFTIDELEGLICALFADTQLRENTLSEIREGHP